MATTGIGNVDVVFTANTTRFSAAINEMGSSLTKTAAAASTASRQIGQSLDSLSQRAGESQRHFEERAAAAASAREKTSAELAAGARAVDRYRASWERELVAQDRATAAEETASRVRQQVALQLDILARANEKLAASTAPVAGSFAAMSASVRASANEMSEALVATAEKAELSADGIAAGFGGIGKLLGAGIAADFAAHMLDNIAELNVRLQDLHEKTGMDVRDLSGLRLIAQSKGLDFETISTGITRLGNAMYEARRGMTEAKEAFSTLGISMQEVNSLSVEQMFYRVSKAIGENRDLTIDDGTALELFSRGGREVIPLLREYGSGLQAVSKQQGALTGMTNESGEAAQRWLQATQDLSAQLHSALVPVMVDMVRMLPRIELEFHGLQYVTEAVFGTLINDAATVVDSIGDIAKAVKAVAELHPFAAGGDIKAIWTANASGWAAQAKGEREALAAEAAARARIGKPLAVRGENFGGGGTADGALLQQAKQELATMERKHALSRAQLIKFWQDILAKAAPGSVDFEQVNLVLGNLMQHVGRALAARAIPMLRVSGATPIERAQRSMVRSAALQQSADGKFQVDQFQEGLKSARDRVDAIDQLQELATKLTAKAQLFEISDALAQGRLSKYQAVVAEAKVHEASFTAELANLDKRLLEARSLADLPGMSQQIAKLQGQRQELVLSGAQRGTTDQEAIRAQTVGGATVEALAQMVETWKDMASQIADLLKQTVGGLNDDIVKAILAPGQNHRQIEAMFGQTLQSSAGSLLKAGLQKGEAGLFGALGMGGRPDGSKSNPLYVKFSDGFGDAGRELGMSHGARDVFGGSAGASAEGAAGENIFGSIFHKLFGVLFDRENGSGTISRAAPSFAGNEIEDLIRPNPIPSSEQIEGEAAGARVGQAVTAAVSTPGHTDSSVFGSMLSIFGRAAGGGRTPAVSSGIGPTTETPGLPLTFSLPNELQDLYELQDLGATHNRLQQIPSRLQLAAQAVIPSAPDLQPQTINQVTRPQPSALGRILGDAGTFLTALIPRADGGLVSPGTAYLVGERGPEILTGASGRIFNNMESKRLMGSGSGSSEGNHTWNIDARGSSDPAKTIAQFDQYMQRAAPQIAAMAMRSMRDDQARRPATSR